jgi:hypothetical protein
MVKEKEYTHRRMSIGQTAQYGVRGDEFRISELPPVYQTWRLAVATLGHAYPLGMVSCV